jgi:hypothetical protein
MKCCGVLFRLRGDTGAVHEDDFPGACLFFQERRFQPFLVDCAGGAGGTAFIGIPVAPDTTFAQALNKIAGKYTPIAGRIRFHRRVDLCTEVEQRPRFFCRESTETAAAIL